MSHQIKTMYVIHHSHTDIGYTDLQERVIYGQAGYIRTVLELMKNPANRDFRWNCETWYCVETFLKTASEEEKEEFFRLIEEKKIGLSANYLNFTDLVDCQVLNDRLDEVCGILKEYNIPLRTAMFADINGISMGQRDALINHGVEFLYTNIHCHHGMYPLYQNQKAFWWENESGKRLLVWNGEHYNLGNALGIRPNKRANYMTQGLFGEVPAEADEIEVLHRNLEEYVSLCEENGYNYDFLIASVSGVFSDNAPPETGILRVIQEYNKRSDRAVKLEMVSLQELYDRIGEKLTDSPVYRGDMADWWANGVGSTPYAVKHYLDARHRYDLCKRLDEKTKEHYPELSRTAEDNLLLYAEHTWGHSSTISCPYDTMVLNLDMRKNSYASKAHEAASMMLNQIADKKGDILRYYNTSGRLKVCRANREEDLQVVEFYVENPYLERMRITGEDGKEIPCQVSLHPRGRRITFLDSFAGVSEKYYTYEELPPVTEKANSRKAYVGAERIRDIVNDYDPVTYRLPYEMENRWFRLTYRPKEGITGFYSKTDGRNLLGEGAAPFFTPLYECTSVANSPMSAAGRTGGERSIMGRNIRGKHAVLHTGRLEEIICRERGDVFTILELVYTLPGTMHCSVFLKLYEAIPRIDFRMEVGKTISTDIESVFLPMTLSVDDHQELYLKKGAEAFRPGIDQLPGSCMEYYASDDGLAFVGEKQSILVASRDVPLFYMGEMRHHPILLCDQKEENNRRPIYSWVMNNTWETNFKMDLSGFCEYQYSLWLSGETMPEKAMEELKEKTFDPYPLIVE
ncbi:MAG: hypothetical protein PUJ62_05950 [Lachnospiraceae bacterium]|nr:hypothetical protein [Lachnospiraceae bacterium]